jgi:hypothetical protein
LFAAQLAEIKGLNPDRPRTPNLLVGKSSGRREELLLAYTGHTNDARQGPFR